MADMDITLGLDKETPKLLRKQLKEAFSLSGLEDVTEGQRAYFKKRVSGIRSSLSRKETSIFESDLSKVQKKKALDVEFAMALSKTLDLRRQLFSGKLPDINTLKVGKEAEKEKSRDKVQNKQLKETEKGNKENKTGFSKLKDILSPFTKVYHSLSKAGFALEKAKENTSESRGRAVEFEIAKNILGNVSRTKINRIITGYEKTGIVGKQEALGGLISLQQQRTQAMLGKNPNALQGFKWLGVDYMKKDIFDLYDDVYNSLMKKYTSKNEEERRLAVSFVKDIFGDERHLIPMLERFRNPRMWQENRRLVNSQQLREETDSLDELNRAFSELQIATNGLKDSVVSLLSTPLIEITDFIKKLSFGIQDLFRGDLKNILPDIFSEDKYMSPENIKLFSERNEVNKHLKMQLDKLNVPREKIVENTNLSNKNLSEILEKYSSKIADTINKIPNKNNVEIKFTNEGIEITNNKGEKEKITYRNM